MPAEPGPGSESAAHSSCVAAASARNWARLISPMPRQQPLGGGADVEQRLPFDGVHELDVGAVGPAVLPISAWATRSGTEMDFQQLGERLVEDPVR